MKIRIRRIKKNKKIPFNIEKSKKKIEKKNGKLKRLCPVISAYWRYAMVLDARTFGQIFFLSHCLSFSRSPSLPRRVRRVAVIWNYSYWKMYFVQLCQSSFFSIIYGVIIIKIIRMPQNLNCHLCEQVISIRLANW